MFRDPRIYEHVASNILIYLSGGTLEAPREHPRGTQEAPGGSQGTRGVFDAKCAKTIVFYSKNGAREPFRVDGSDVTLTVPAACAQKLAATHPGQRPQTLHPASKTSRQNPSV